jgi:hypothetical protein
MIVLIRLFQVFLSAKNKAGSISREMRPPFKGKIKFKE